MRTLKRFNDETPLILKEEEKKNVIKKTNESLSCLMFFKDLIQKDKVIMTNVWGCLGLNESYHIDLSKMVSYDSILAKEKNERHKEIREKNEEIRKLTEQRGKEVTPEAIEGALKRYEDILRTWYENEGFNYGSISKSSAYGITIELVSEMNFKEKTRHDNNDIYKKIWSNNISTEAKIENGWDLHKSQFHAELLDTENNKKRMQELLLTCFPNVQIFKFSGRRNDYNGFFLSTEFNVLYTDLENYYNSLIIK